MKGDSIYFGGTNLDKNIYGTKGAFAPSNRPAAEFGYCNWSDSSGRLYLFGGGRNALWIYDPQINQWAWVKGDTVNSRATFGVKGVESSTNSPGGRHHSPTWLDKKGQAWIYGSYVDPFTQPHSDVWRYNNSTGNWTWMGGDSLGFFNPTFGVKGIAAGSNSPGYRRGSVTWVDTAGNLWLFGGHSVYAAMTGLDPGNDLWKFNTTTLQWTWMSGSTSANVIGNYGTQGVPSIDNYPSARSYAFGWTDANNGLLLFGGAFHDDIWRYNISTNEWTWLKGESNGHNLPVYPVYGTKGVASSNNTPGSRSGSAGWSDGISKIFLYSGRTWQPGNNSINCNDVWSYDQSTNEWTWIAGDQYSDSGFYGTSGVASPLNKPTGRSYGTSWSNVNGNFWMFGGHHFKDANPTRTELGVFNDLWKFSSFTVTPVHLISFAGKPGKETTLLTWNVENEQNFDRYEVERSLDGEVFKNIGKVKAKNSSNYSYTDDTKDYVGKKLWYRLKLIDKDGSYTYSKIVQLQIPSKSAFSIYPNPATTSVNIHFDKAIQGKLNIKLVDFSGKVIAEKTYSNQNIKMPVASLPAGNYYLKLFYNNEQFVEKIVINK